MKKEIFIYITLIIFLFAPSTQAATIQWATDGVSVCNDSSSSTFGDIVPDGEGGAIIIWEDPRSGNAAYGQRLDINGNPLWALNGKDLSFPFSSTLNLQSISDGNNGAYMFTYLAVNRIQRIDVDGNAQWTPYVTNNYGYAFCSSASTDNLGNLIVTWSDNRNGSTDIFIQKYNNVGIPLWTYGGVTVCADPSEQVPTGEALKIDVNDLGESIVSWADDRNGNQDIFAQKINSAGIVQWTYDGVTICSDSSAQDFLEIEDDSSGGAIIVWEDNRNGTDDVFMQHVDSSGTITWTYDGVTVCAESGNQFKERIRKITSGKYFIVWQDERAGSAQADLYIQRITTGGVQELDTNGKVLCNATDRQWNPLIYATDIGGAVITWTDLRNGTWDAYAQEVDENGDSFWTSNGLAICTAAGSQNQPKMIKDDFGGAIFAWADGRANWDVYAQRVLLTSPTYTVTPTITVSPTITPTPTVTPVTRVFVNTVSPEYLQAAASQQVIIRGSGYQDPAAVKLTRAGSDLVSASAVTVLDYNTLSCAFDLSGIAPGACNVVVTSAAVQGTGTDILKVLGTLQPPILWSMTDMGQAGSPAVGNDTRGIWVGDADTDSTQEVFTAGLLQNILKYDLDSTWSVAPLPAGGIGEYYTDVLAADMDNDGEKEIYGATLDDHVYSFSGTDYTTKTDISGDLGYDVVALVLGDGNNDNTPELYAAYGSSSAGYIIQYDYSSGWSNTVVASTTARIYDIAVGDGNNDDVNEIYAACADDKVYQFVYNGTSWEQSIVHTGEGAARKLALGDGNNDGDNEVYCANLDGNIYQSKWSTGFFWASTTITAKDALGLVVTDGDNNGTLELYSAGSDRSVYQYVYSGGAWTETALLTLPQDAYAMASGDGDNDYLNELYVLAGNHHVYEVNASHAVPTPTPTRTPVPDFDGEIISKDHVYAAPNPVRGSHANINIYMNQAGEVSAKLFTTSNQEVLSFKRWWGVGLQTERINISNLANGVYILLVNAKANGTEERVVKKIAIVK